MYEIKVDKQKNLLYLKLQGFIFDDELSKAFFEVKKSLDILKPHFDEINDISEFKPATQKGKEIILDTQKYIANKGVSRVVRIIGNLIGQNQLDRSPKEDGYTAISVRTLHEAHNFLETHM